ncbi:kinase-like domain-containing protein [Thamnocephalis sphaerospora]|uniref:Kinase-like domain-containing protein n=1 Tax=Thamnocephalis sphaerospora TaxID=78915 RepID=A0A4P9XQS9_9FUNG|nr:kinase-like domain-containing protein [Thamnocephalis sphaerospora]|eukprot:RKP07861.1 kinase-like domain-containing protein [Thamnocephalis sphaerospora]
MKFHTGIAAIGSMFALLVAAAAAATIPSGGSQPDLTSQDQLQILFRLYVGDINDYAAHALYNDEPAFIKCMLDAESYKREVGALAAIKHIASASATPPTGIKHIVKMLHNFSTPNEYHCVVMEQLSGTYLDNVVRQANEDERDAVAREIFRQTLLGTQALHDAGFAHGDLKGKHIMISTSPVTDTASEKAQGVVKYRSTMVELNAVIIDLGTTTLWKQRERPSHFSAVNFMAPELLAYQKGLPVPDMRYADIWSLGVALYRTLEDEYPFHPTLIHQFAQASLSSAQSLDQWRKPRPMNHWNRAVEEMVKEILRPEANLRPLPSALLTRSHWLKDNAEDGTRPAPSKNARTGSPLRRT